MAVAEARADVAEAELAVARAKASDDQAQIAHLKLQIAKLQRQLFGPHAERTRRLLDQLELQLEELEASASEDEIAAEMAAAKTQSVSGPRASRSPSTCRASAWWSLRRAPARRAAARASPSWARTSPRRWR